MYQHGSSLFEEPLDPDSEEELEGEELDESDVWRNAVWRNAYDFLKVLLLQADRLQMTTVLQRQQWEQH